MVNENGDAVAAKAAALTQIARSVTAGGVPRSPNLFGESLILWAAGIADSFYQWGYSPMRRDRQLREFIPTENNFTAALGTVVARNAGFHWALEGPPRTVELAQELLLTANGGKGWQNFMSTLSIDLYTQDRGSFIELIRENPKSPESPVIGLKHLDAQRCHMTGVPKVPVVYQDRHGVLHAMAAWQVVTLLEMPSPVENPINGPYQQLQYCALTRMLKAAQVVRNIVQYDDEKTSGRFQRAIHMIKGISVKQIEDSLAQAENEADSRGLMRFLQPLIVASTNPQADLDYKTLELAGVPDNFDSEKSMKNYITVMSNAFMTDYQEFAPLPGGNLGTSAQSEVLHLKSRGKGPALFQALISHLMNFMGVLPRNVTFTWDEQDTEADKQMAEVGKVRAEMRDIRIKNGEIDEQTARKLALEAGDLSQEMYDELEAKAEEDAAMMMTTPPTPVPDIVEGEEPAGGGGSEDEIVEGETAERGTKDEPDDREILEAVAESGFVKILDIVSREVKREIAQQGL